MSSRTLGSGRAPRVLIAPDKFKGSLTAPEVAHAVAAGVRRVRPGAELVTLPVADGGDGTLDAAIAAGFERVEVVVAGPTGEPVRTAFARRGSVAVVEMADACGLARLSGGRLHPLTASSRGLGEVLVAALEAGCRDLVVGIGGSASTDGGAGLVSALGGVLLDAHGRPLPEGGAALRELDALNLSGLHPGLAESSVVIACDVDNPLTGTSGAAAVYGPQKGASPDDVVLLDAGLRRLAEVVASATGRDLRESPGAGAAGGVGYAATALLGAHLRPGIALMLDLLDFDARLHGADLVVTGEGSLDAQSLHGKAPLGVARAAAANGVTVVAVCGRRTLDDAALHGAGIAAAYALLDLEPDPAVSMRDAAALLEVVGELIARDHLPAAAQPG